MKNAVPRTMSALSALDMVVSLTLHFCAPVPEAVKSALRKRKTRIRYYILPIEGSAMTIGSGSATGSGCAAPQAATRAARPRTANALMLFDIFVSSLCAEVPADFPSEPAPRPSV